MIRYLRNNEIDFMAWDECILQSPNGLVYGYSWFLDLCADQWDALILDDYDAVMPLPWREKRGFHYLYQPEMTQQGGVFSRVNLSPDLLSEFIAAIPRRFRLVEIMLNYGNNFSLPKLTERRNIVLRLNNNIDQIREKYSENTRRNIKKAKREEFTISNNFDLKNIMRLFTVNKGVELKISEYWIKRVSSITHALHHKGYGQSMSLYNNYNECVAGVFYVFYEQRIYFLFSGSGEKARKSGAMHFLIDALIEKYANSSNILDFEGSNNEGLARFYKSFGAVEQNYPILKINRLPFYLKWLKK